MKTIKFYIISILIIILGDSNVVAQNQKQNNVSTKTESFKVWGKCESCKARIEKAAKVDGVNNAVWDIKTKILTITYSPSKVNSDKVQKNIAAAGHDTEKYKADDKVYNALPDCCHYERKE